MFSGGWGGEGGLGGGGLNLSTCVWTTASGLLTIYVEKSEIPGEKSNGSRAPAFHLDSLLKNGISIPSYDALWLLCVVSPVDVDTRSTFSISRKVKFSRHLMCTNEISIQLLCVSQLWRNIRAAFPINRKEIPERRQVRFPFTFFMIFLLPPIKRNLKFIPPKQNWT